MRKNQRKIFCIECNKDVIARLTDGTELYPHQERLHHLKFWKCDTCKNSVGTHRKYSGQPKPLGCIPNNEIKNARMHIHNILDPLWKTGRISRKELYKIISEFLGYEYHTGDIKNIEEARKIYKKIKQLHLEIPIHKYKIIDDVKSAIGQKCHVVGWNYKAVFIVEDFINGIVFLRTPKTGKKITTKNKITELANKNYHRREISKN